LPGTLQILAAFVLALIIFGGSLKSLFLSRPRRMIVIVRVQLLVAAGVIITNAFRW
jgi:hypothetical protein